MKILPKAWEWDEEEGRLLPACPVVVSPGVHRLVWNGFKDAAPRPALSKKEESSLLSSCAVVRPGSQ